jgi:hypothetical protein
MRKAKFSESQIVGILKEADAGVPPLTFLPRPQTAGESTFRLST